MSEKVFLLLTCIKDIMYVLYSIHTTGQYSMYQVKITIFITFFFKLFFTHAETPQMLRFVL
jgi:hypothetical protein